MPSRVDIVNEARTYIGVPWRHQGRTRKGLDCIGLLVVVAQKLDLTVRDVVGYGRRPEGFNFTARFKEEMEEIPLRDIKPGDAVTFADDKFVCHVGIVTEKYGKVHIIHGHATRRQVLEEAYEGEWERKARKAFRFPQLED
jgi:cell wall-associated NlpC family hydrolase